MADLKALTGANVMIKGSGRVGQVKKFDAPAVVQETLDYKGLGLLAAEQIPVGLKAMDATLTLSGPYGDTIKDMANPNKVVDYMIKGNIDVVDSKGRKEQKPIVVEMSAYNLEVKPGGFGHGENSEPEVKLAVTYFMLNYEGVELLKVDLRNNIYVVAGEDQLAAYRGNLGL